MLSEKLFLNHHKTAFWNV